MEGIQSAAARHSAPNAGMGGHSGWGCAALLPQRRAHQRYGSAPKAVALVAVQCSDLQDPRRAHRLAEGDLQQGGVPGQVLALRHGHRAGSPQVGARHSSHGALQPSAEVANAAGGGEAVVAVQGRRRVRDPVEVRFGYLCARPQPFSGRRQSGHARAHTTVGGERT